MEKKKKPISDGIRTILHQKDIGRMLIALGLFMIITGGEIEILMPTTVFLGTKPISVGGILVMLGILTFLLGVVIVILGYQPPAPSHF